MTWLEFERKVVKATSRLLMSEELPIVFLHGEMEIRPDDITIGCEITGGKLALIIDLKEGGGK